MKTAARKSKGGPEARRAPEGVARSAALALQAVLRFLREDGFLMAQERGGRPATEGLAVRRPSPTMVTVSYHVPEGQKGPEATERLLEARERAMSRLREAGFPLRGACIVCEGP